jgi:hypothetical protein
LPAQSRAHYGIYNTARGKFAVALRLDRRRQTHTFIATDASRQSDHHHRRWLYIFGGFGVGAPVRMERPKCELCFT